MSGVPRTAPALMALAVLSAAPGAAQDVRDTFQLEELVVTPTRLATPRTAVPVSVTVLDGRDLRARGVHQVLDALREVLGAAVVQVGSQGGLTSLFVRGGESDYVAVLLDGVPLNQPGGAIDLANLTTENLERIEIVRGPVSVLYGSDAVTGVVHLITEAGGAAPRVGAGVRVGSFEATPPLGSSGALAPPTNHSAVVTARVNGGIEGVSYGLSATRTASQGLYTRDGTAAFDNGYDQSAMGGVFSIAPDSLTDARLSFRYADHAYHYPTDGAGRFVDHNTVSRESATSLGLEVGRFLHPRVETRLLLVSHATNGMTDDRPDGPADTLGFYASESSATVERRRAEGRVNAYLGRGATLTVGAMAEQERERGFSAYSSAFGPDAASTDLERSSRAYYAQLQMTTVRSGFNVGGRVDDNAAFGRFATYRAGVTYRVLGRLRLRAAAGTGFKEPTFFENFATGFVRGNPDLRPERSTSAELGAEWGLVGGRVVLATTVYTQHFRDLIDFTFSPPSAADPNYFNVVGADAAGIEVEGRATISEAWTASAGYTYLSTRVTDGGFDQTPGAQLVPGARLLRRPDHSAVVTLRLRASGRVRAHAQLRHVGARGDRDFSVFPSDPVRLDPYTVTDTGLDLDAARWDRSVLTLQLRVENLLGAAVRETYNFPARGRTLWVGVDLR